MNTKLLANTAHALNHRKLAKPLALCIAALFVISAVSILAMYPVKAQTTTTPALQTSGSSIVDANGNVVYLRGIGLAGMAPDIILWGQGATDNWGTQWSTDPAVMDQTFSTMQSQWHINMIRVFVYPSWYYRDNIVPAQEDPAGQAAKTTPISTKAYLQTICNEAAKYGIYVDIVPYMLTPSTSSFGSDPYATPNFGWQGLPMSGWDDAGNRFLQAAGYGNNELGFWNWFWTDMANNLKNCPNAIFEAWNEPNLGSDTDAIPAGYMTYLTTMYSAIRATGATNLVMMQWHMGWFPNGYGNDLSWCKQIATAIPSATNLVYTTHLYYYAPTDLTSYWANDYNGLKTQLQTGINSMGVTAPLVINEEGSCLAYTSNRQNDCTWWSNLLLAQRDLGIGAGAYYWLSESGLGPIYAGETMLSNGYAANDMGQAFINAYQASKATVASTATATPEPTATPTSTPTATPEPTQTPQPTEDPTLAPTTQPAEPTQPSAASHNIQVVHGFFYHHWFIFYWPQYNSWFAFHLW